MKLIAMVDKNWAIGKNGKQLVNIPEDMQLFRQETMGNVVIMGRKTLESLKNKSVLEGRINIVITNDKNYSVKDAIMCHSIEEACEEAAKFEGKDVYVIGGGTIYEQMLDMCDEAHITKVDYTYDADTFFPNLDKREDWQITATSEEKTYFDIVYEFVKYEKKQQKG